MKKEDAINKIKKCLALAASDNPNEAATALRQAQALMKQHGLTVADVKVTEAMSDGATVNFPRWEMYMANMVAKAFGCDVFTKLSPGFFENQKRSVIFVGLEPNAEIAAYAHSVLHKQCSKDRRKHMRNQHPNCKRKTRTARGDLYAEGWCVGVSSKLDKLVPRPEEQALIKNYMDAKKMDICKPKNRIKGKNVTTTDFAAGSVAGKQANIHHGVNRQGKDQALLTGEAAP